MQIKIQNKYNKTPSFLAQNCREETYKSEFANPGQPIVIRMHI
jgi:hypothetical protein